MKEFLVSEKEFTEAFDSYIQLLRPTFPFKECFLGIVFGIVAVIAIASVFPPMLASLAGVFGSALSASLVAILLVVFLWGPQKLPELVKSIGIAKKEFDQAVKEGPDQGASSTASSTTPTESAHPLIVAARSLGISTEGKTNEQIAKEIADGSPK